MPVDEALEHWEVEPERGLQDAEAERRRERYGANRLAEVRRRSLWAIALDQVRSVVILLLFAAAATAAVFGQFIESIAIAAALVITVLVGLVMEYSATRSMDALRRIGQTRARVRRDGEPRELGLEQLVPGDIVLLQPGDVVPADLRLVQVENLSCDESALTGESTPVSKSVEALDRDEVPLAERSCMAFRGSAVTRGAAEGVVVASGEATELGRISQLVQETGDEQAPLERRLERLSHRLIVLVLVVGAMVGVSGILAGNPLLLMVETAIVLAIAAVPEGLPVVATLSLSRGMWRMARRNALVKGLPAVETLGAATMILADKTGTLTENRMVLRRLALADGDVQVEASREERAFGRDDAPYDPNEHPPAQDALRVGVLCSNARLAEASAEASEGDPMEVALLEGGVLAGMRRADLLERWPEEREEAFDPETKMMATFHRDEDGYLVAVKGAPEAVIEVARRERGDGDDEEELDESRREAWRERNRKMAADGLRVLALAQRRASDASEDPYRDLVLLGLVGLYDPPRQAVRDAIRDCQQAGVQVVMVTGDQAATAENVAREVGIGRGDEVRAIEAGSDAFASESGDRLREASVFARVSPEGKFALVRALQEAGEVVGMTGDGVNDAPALKKADIGIAMGRRGTDVAREAGDIVLRDDAFETIVMAIRQGRTIFANIRKAVIFLLSGNLGQIVAVSACALVGAPLPLLPLQILFLNLVLDVFPALALGMGGDEQALMRRPPRDPQEAILTRGHWLAITGFGVLIGVSVLAAFAIALLLLRLDVAAAVTVAFLTFGICRLGHLFNMREPDSAALRNNVVRNPFVWGALLVCIALLLTAVYLPALADLLELRVPEPGHWLLAVAVGLVPLVVGQVGLAIAGHRQRAAGRSRAPESAAQG